jgi:Predicted membrane protein
VRADLPARLFSLSGRLNVPEAFVLHLMLSALGAVLVWAATRDAGWQHEIWGKLVVQAIVALGGLVLLTKRLHDHGWSGWWALLGLPLIPLGLYRSWRVTLRNPDVLTGSPDPWWYLPAQLLSLPLIVLMLGVFFIPGSAQENRYGPSPRGSRDESYRAA